MSETDNNNLDLALARGIDQFNRQEFFACHETLEELWLHDTSEERELLQGIIQIAVGYHHFMRNNRAGALKLWKRGLNRIQKYRTTHLRLNIDKLFIDVSANIESINSSEAYSPLNLPIIEILPN